MVAKAYRSKLRTAIDGNTGTRDPARPIGRHERDYIGNIFRFADTLQCLHPKRDLATCFSLREIRHIRVDHTGRDSIYANALRPKNGGPVFDQSL